MKNTIGRRMLVVIFIPFIVIFGVLSAYITRTITVYVTDWMELEIKGISEINAAELNGRMYSVEVSVQSAADSLYVLDPEAKNVREQADGVVKAMFENGHIYNAWLAFEPQAFDGRDEAFTQDYPGAPSGRFIRSYIMEEDKIIVAPDMQEETLDDPGLSPWYVIPRDTGRMYIDTNNEIPNLYDYGVGGDPVYTLSVVAPIYREGHVIGCVGADVLFADMTFGLDQNRQSAVAVFYPNGRIFYSSDLQYAEECVNTLGFTQTDLILEAISSGESLFLPDEYSVFLDEQAFTYFQPVQIRDAESGDLFLYVAAPRSEALNALIPVYILIAVVCAAVLAVISVMYLYVSNSISKPIRKLTLAADAISQGNIETEITSFSEAEDEVGLMSRSLHRMVEQFRVYILQLEQAQAEMSVHTKIMEIFRNSESMEQTLTDLAAMLCRYLGIYKASTVLSNYGAVCVESFCEPDGEQTRIESRHMDFLYHSQVSELIANKKLLCVNAFAIAEHNIKFVDAETISVCLVPLRRRNILHGYLILENKDIKHSFSSGEETLLLYVAEIVTDWLSQKDRQPGEAPEARRFTLAEEETPEEMPIPAEQSGAHPAEPERQPDSESAQLAALRNMEELDVDLALQAMGGLEDLYEQSVSLLARLLPDALRRLDTCLNDDLDIFAIEIHGLKGSLNNIGAYGLGREAARLEREAKAGNVRFCQEQYPPLKASILVFQQKTGDIFGGTADKRPGDLAQLKEVLDKTIEATQNYDALDAQDLLRSLEGFAFGEPADTLLKDIGHALETFEFTSALAAMHSLRDVLRQ